MWIALGVAVVGGGAYWWYTKNKKESSTGSSVTPPAPLDTTKQTGSGITKQTVAPRIPGAK